VGAIQGWAVSFPVSELEVVAMSLSVEWVSMIELLVVAARRICNSVWLRI
jgi:hypothetical protein